MVEDFGVHYGLVVFAAVGDRRICAAELVIVHAVSQTAQGKSLIDIAVYTAVGLLTLDQCSDTEFLTVVEA